MVLAGVATLLTWSTAAAATASASTSSKRLTAYVPKNALSCELAATRQNPRKYCKKCNPVTTLGAADSVKVQIGGCGENEGDLTSVCEFTAAGMECFETITVPRLETGEIGVGELSAADLTVNTLTVTGTSVHAGLEVFNGTSRRT